MLNQTIEVLIAYPKFFLKQFAQVDTIHYFCFKSITNTMRYSQRIEQACTDIIEANDGEIKKRIFNNSVKPSKMITPDFAPIHSISKKHNVKVDHVRKIMTAQY